jgi:hypothetical protein
MYNVKSIFQRGNGKCLRSIVPVWDDQTSLEETTAINDEYRLIEIAHVEELQNKN